MKKSEIDRMAHYEATYWWHIGRKDIVARQLQNYLGDSKKKLKILNVGAGTGGTVPMLEKYGSVTNLELSKPAIQYMKKIGIKDIIEGDATELEAKEGTYDVVIALDVLEHIDSESKALVEWKRVLKKDGLLLVTVPAYPSLWSEHDESLNHFRRYTRPSARNALTVADYRIKKLSYAFAFSLPLVYGYRILGRILPKSDKKTTYVSVPKPINSLFAGILKIESRLLTKMWFPFGTTVLFVAQKRD